VLIIDGKNDWIMDETALHTGIIHSKLVIFDNCGHFPWKDKKNNFLSEVSLFIT
jgi:pimeloyl-ACP methyl ester carboxylesterase